eukprot:GHVT01041362.1.p1 GENE.GHVT01041362.1~~GHVT01041362.1.p1  ORF type:complete len:319 (-),score=68.22 GHVT01041362.1:2897-3853(-)
MAEIEGNVGSAREALNAEEAGGQAGSAGGELEATTSWNNSFSSCSATSLPSGELHDLARLVANLLKDPTNQQYTKLRIANPRIERLLLHGYAIDALTKAGFIQDESGGHLICHQVPPLLTLQNIHEELQCARTKRNEEPQDPPGPASEGGPENLQKRSRARQSSQSPVTMKQMSNSKASGQLSRQQLGDLHENRAKRMQGSGPRAQPTSASLANPSVGGFFHNPMLASSSSSSHRPPSSASPSSSPSSSSSASSSSSFASAGSYSSTRRHGVECHYAETYRRLRQAKSPPHTLADLRELEHDVIYLGRLALDYTNHFR